MERTGMKSSLKISKAFVQAQPKVQFQRTEERLKIEAIIYTNLEKRLRTEIHTFLLHFFSLRSTLVAAIISKDQMPSPPVQTALSLWKRDLHRELFLHIPPSMYLIFWKHRNAGLTGYSTQQSFAGFKRNILNYTGDFHASNILTHS